MTILVTFTRHHPSILASFCFTISLSCCNHRSLCQGWDDPYVPQTHEGLLKWKYPEMNSVDPLIEIRDERELLYLNEEKKPKLMEGSRVVFQLMSYFTFIRAPEEMNLIHHICFFNSTIAAFWGKYIFYNLIFIYFSFLLMCILG
ncbi:unnamed protein product [Cuscuta europaea]|uniref:Uncharacterized protein n=1 Tax=Cuscuta europaea TaxID=41803 RepID=A0A9P0Z1W0_CUSEU|nr:unnamed protein product [Cuscuta europaea]